jgi:alpha-L-rhamnosidase
MAGVTRLKIRGAAGTPVRLKHGEMLGADGRVNLGNIDYHYRPTDDSDPFQTDIVILSGGDDEFAARFNYKGFQYVEVSAPVALSLTLESLTAEEMHSDVPVIGHWQSSSAFLNNLLQATNNSYLSNLFGYPTDCPQREKNGWTADAWLALETGMATYDVVTIFEKWMADFRDEQKGDGRLPCIVPTDKWGYDWANGVDWTSATILIPWQIYLYYNDRQLLADHYLSMKRYVCYIEGIAKDHLTDWGLGDWIPVKSTSDLTYTTSVYYFVDATIMAKVARILGYETDACHYEQLASDIRQAINQRFLDREKGCYADGTQTELAMALYWNLVDDDMRPRIAARLNDAVVRNGWHLDVGVHGCKAILTALSDNGYADTAWRLVTQQTYPSWGWWIVQGATTLHENWKTDVIIDNSLNHIMFGEVGAWLYKGLAGIRPCEQAPGFREVMVTPYFPQDLDSLSVSRETGYGRLETAWHRQGDAIVYTLNVPKAMTVHLSLPDGRQLRISGQRKQLKLKP